MWNEVRIPARPGSRVTDGVRLPITIVVESEVSITFLQARNGGRRIRMMSGVILYLLSLYPYVK